MSNLLVNTRDQKFLIYEQIGIEKLFAFDRFADYSQDVVDMVLSEAEKMAVEVIAPTLEEGDKEGAQFKDGKAYAPSCYQEPFKKYCEAGWLCASEEPEVGGQNLPVMLRTAVGELFAAANMSFTMYPGLTHGAANLVKVHGTEEQKNKYMYKMFAGEWGGTMCLTEPGAGSDVGALRTSAKRLPDGRFSITGTKCFISSGDHDLTENIVHPVLARIEGDPPGTKGISIFVVPKIRVNDDGSLGEPNDVVTGNIEHKMGIKGSATATLNFGENGNCIGELLGGEREGMKIMFQMMNEARLDVGLQGQAVASAAFEHAVAYSKERIQSKSALAGKDPNAEALPIINHPPVRRMLMWMKAYLEGIRALNYFTGFSIDVSHASSSEEERNKYGGYVEIMTPICKAFSSDRGVEICSKAMDVYGGYGFCQEYPVEQYMRDCKITQIYEGTNQIQALDLIGRKLGQNGGMNIMSLFEEISATISRVKERENLRSYAAKLEEAYNSVAELPMKFIEFFKSGKPAATIQNAEPFLAVMGDLLCGWLLLQGADIALEKLDAIYKEAGADTVEKQKALAENNTEAAFYEGKIASAKFFASEILPTVRTRCEIVKAGEIIPVEIAEVSFAY
ncbi:MAG: acyl-CoA dehydrogenase [Syntrophales bacterium]|jgi:alkylation response protein AidB-like acyl-CoA dehydrogenase|nr:acyl-CoA dehydrogenase [Syntrophales bacterium]MDY0044735.1 acyl-CoA dehydrogenase [Syntrophales bacterium]